MRNSRFRSTAVVAALLLAFTATVPVAAVWVDDEEPEIGLSRVSPQQEPAPPATASPTSEAQLKKIIESTQVKLDQSRAAAGFPGATVGFVLPDGRSASVLTGVSDLVTKRPLVPTDLLLAGSVGKTFIAAVMIQLAQEGKVNLDDKIANWFKSDSWFASLPNANDITVRMLLNHTSGIAHHPDEEKFFKALAANRDRQWKPEEIVALVLNKKPPFAAGKGFSYSDTNYILAGMIIERVTGATLYSEVTRRFLKPLRLDRTVPQTGSGHGHGYRSKRTEHSGEEN